MKRAVSALLRSHTQDGTNRWGDLSPMSPSSTSQPSMRESPRMWTVGAWPGEAPSLQAPPDCSTWRLNSSRATTEAFVNPGRRAVRPPSPISMAVAMTRSLDGVNSPENSPPFRTTPSLDPTSRSPASDQLPHSRKIGLGQCSVALYVSVDNTPYSDIRHPLP